IALALDIDPSIHWRAASAEPDTRTVTLPAGSFLDFANGPVSDPNAYKDLWWTGEYLVARGQGPTDAGWQGNGPAPAVPAQLGARLCAVGSIAELPNGLPIDPDEFTDHSFFRLADGPCFVADVDPHDGMIGSAIIFSTGVTADRALKLGYSYPHYK